MVFRFQRFFSRIIISTKSSLCTILCNTVYATVYKKRIKTTQILESGQQRDANQLITSFVLTTTLS